jgi:GNAT superfamily N-acetyltransferase
MKGLRDGRILLGEAAGVKAGMGGDGVDRRALPAERDSGASTCYDRAMILHPIDWAARAVESEIAYSVARGGVATSYGAFVHIRNLRVPLGGDFNRAAGVIASSLDEFGSVTEQVEDMHQDAGLPPPDRFDLHPSVPTDSAWIEELGRMGYRSSVVHFLRGAATADALPSSFEWLPISAEVYLSGWTSDTSATGYDAEGVPPERSASERGFIRVFRPFGLSRSGVRVASVHCAVLRGYARLFDVYVEPECRGEGIGRLLMQAVRREAARSGAKQLLLCCGPRVRPFYEACGFVECARGVVVRSSGPAARESHSAPGRLSLTKMPAAR